MLKLAIRQSQINLIPLSLTESIGKNQGKEQVTMEKTPLYTNTPSLLTCLADRRIFLTS